MKNLKNFEGNCFEVFKEAVKNKNEGDKKERLNSISDRIKPQFDIYSEKFQNKKLYEIAPLVFSSLEKDSLLDLYQYKSKIIKIIKNKILDSQIRTINTTCQYCTLNSVSSLDHYIPKDDFPEFSVNPLNLFPCCTECNSKKSKYCFEREESLFLNLYLDSLPDENYLQADFDFTDNIPLVTFSLINSAMIDDSTFNVIKSHYTKLNLLDRMRHKSNEIVTEIIHSLKTNYRLNADIELLKTFIGSEELENMEAYGSNYWKSVLKLSLINYNEFWEKHIC